LLCICFDHYYCSIHLSHSFSFLSKFIDNIAHSAHCLFYVCLDNTIIQMFRFRQNTYLGNSNKYFILLICKVRLPAVLNLRMALTPAPVTCTEVSNRSYLDSGFALCSESSNTSKRFQPICMPLEIIQESITIYTTHIYLKNDVNIVFTECTTRNTILVSLEIKMK
jgi:hypothetical protein